MGRLVLVHGSVTNGAMTWGAQRPLAERWELVVLDRPGFAPGPAVERVDFDTDALWLAGLLRPGDHLCGHSYGGVVSLLAAARKPVLASLTVSEPPCFGVARGNPAVEEFLEQYESFEPARPREYLEFFLPLVGSEIRLPDALPPALEQGARAAMAERSPDEAAIPLAELAASPFPKLVISGGHNPAFDAVCDMLEARLPAKRVVLPGAGHSLPRASGYNDALVEFIGSAP